LLGLLADVRDPRRRQGKLYKLPHVLLFSILAIVTSGNSYRGIVTFIDARRRRLNATFGLEWRRAPAHTVIRYILKDHPNRHNKHRPRCQNARRPYRLRREQANGWPKRWA
jgi:hypothetical protein